MLPKSPKSGLLSLVRDNLTNIAAFSTVILFFFVPLLSALMGMILCYFIMAQWTDLPFYKPLRQLGYHCWYLQFSNAIVYNNEISRTLLENRSAYQQDYIDMGYKEFDLHASELIALDIRFRRLQEADEILEPYFN